MTNDVASPLIRVAPDDSGATTFARFRYQAKVVFPYLLQCGLGDGPVAVIPEHIEDLLLRGQSGWRFVQIKTRDPARGMWTLGDLLGEDGALRSLFRSYSATQGCDATYEAHLEQSVSPNGNAKLLRTAAGRRTGALIEAVRKALRIRKATCVSFLDRVRLIDALPPREHIDAVNLRLAGSLGVALPHEALQHLYADALVRIEAAMAAEPIGVAWPTYVLDESDEAAKERYRHKHLDRAECELFTARLRGGSTRLLRRKLNPDLPSPTRLEEKLMLAGAPDNIIEDAKVLRAFATAAEFEFLQQTASTEQQKKLADLQERLRFRATSVCAAATADPPGPAVWESLQAALHAAPTTIDPNRVLQQDPLLLMGEVCELSDQCLVNWGVKRA